MSDVSISFEPGARRDHPSSEGPLSSPFRRATLRFLADNYAALLKGAGVGIVLGLLYLLVSSPTYTAQSQLLIDPGLQTVLQDQQGVTPTTMDSPQIETELAVLRSEEIAKTVVDRFKLADDPEYRWRSWWDYLPSSLVPNEARVRADQNRMNFILDKFRKNLLVRRIGVSYAIDIFFSSADPVQAARIANGVAQAYMQFKLESRSGAARAGREWLEGIAAELRTDLNTAARKMQEFRVEQNYGIGRRMDRATPPAPRAGGDGAAAAAPAPTAPARADAHAAGNGMSFEELESNANTYRRTYETVLQALMTAMRQQTFPIANARIITTAIPPLSSSRNAVLTLGLTALLGALAWAGGLMLRDRLIGPGAVGGNRFF